MYASRHALALGCALACACGGASVPFPVKGPEPARDAFEDVADGPPPGRPEIVRLSPNAKAVWVGGQWERVDGKWRWARGGWAVPPAGARFSAFRVLRDKAGTLCFAAARWTDAKGQTIEVERLQTVQP
ncbi:MAG TPA: hypothetical protein VF316_21830 [Polyangiaceae bacterium]